MIRTPFEETTCFTAFLQNSAERSMGRGGALNRAGMPSFSTGGVIGAAALCFLLVLGCSMLTKGELQRQATGGRAVELFSWASFAKEQASLSKDVDGLVSPESKSAILRRGREVVQQVSCSSHPPYLHPHTSTMCSSPPKNSPRPHLIHTF